MPAQVKVAVGPGSRELTGIGHCLNEAASALDLSEDSGEAVVDSVALGVPRLLRSLGQPQLVADFVEEQLGDLLEIDRRRGGQLLETLVVYLRHSGHKTDAAAALHLQRQSLYQRLDRIMAALGHPVPGPAGGAPSPWPSSWRSPDGTARSRDEEGVARCPLTC